MIQSINSNQVSWKLGAEYKVLFTLELKTITGKSTAKLQDISIDNALLWKSPQLKNNELDGVPFHSFSKENFELIYAGKIIGSPKCYPHITVTDLILTAKCLVIIKTPFILLGRVRQRMYLGLLMRYKTRNTMIYFAQEAKVQLLSQRYQPSDANYILQLDKFHPPVSYADYLRPYVRKVRRILPETRSVGELNRYFNNIDLTQVYPDSQLQLKEIDAESAPSVLEESCAICLDELAGKIIETNCKHYYHSSCLSSWLRISEKCPLCKTDVLSI